MNQITEAKAGKTTAEMQQIAERENVSVEHIRDKIAIGEIVIFHSQKKINNKAPIGVGVGLSTKINANIGTSQDKDNFKAELEKLVVATNHGADAIMDLSTGGEIGEIRKRIVEQSQIPVGTVPVYDVMHSLISQGKPIEEATEQDFIDAVEKHVQDGVDFITVHCGVKKSALESLRNNGRIMGVVSRGGSYLCDWMHYHNKENPLFTYFDKIIDLAKKYDVVLSLGDGFRPGCLADASDSVQLNELMVLGDLQQRAFNKDVQVIIEGPGHVPLDQIEMNMKLEKKCCHNAPFYVLGPLVTDIAPGYDHITSAIGGALAAWHGADFLCYVTPAEHLRLPDINDVKEGVIASRIAAHAGDIAKYGARSRNRDDEFSKARMARNWGKQIEGSIDPEKAREYRQTIKLKEDDTCSMCSEFCSAKLNEKFMSKS